MRMLAAEVDRDKGCGRRMFRDVTERFLSDAVETVGDVGRYAGRHTRGGELRANTGTFGEFAGISAQGYGQAQMIERRRMQRIGDAAEIVGESGGGVADGE